MIEPSLLMVAKAVLSWWQVDLGSQKKISQIIIYNRTDCCVDRLSNYQVSISDKERNRNHMLL
jgi:hypothetical protein